ncbi:tRNA (guanosine(37)-N1)-methyltransferase TrmD [Natronospora cellulosivora (SeqCode)]
MFFDILTLFPDMFMGPFTESMIARAQERDIIDINLINIRDYSNDKHKTTDDTPYGGGAGMVMKVEPIFRAYEDLSKNHNKAPVILLSPQGRQLNQDIVRELSQHDGLILLCGHYEGIDERVRDEIVDDEISIGDYVLTGGETAAIVLVDAIARMLPGFLGDEQSKIEDSFYNGLLDYPHYTRPRTYRNKSVPDVLLSGNHAAIDRWRRKEALKRTLLRRPDLIEEKDFDKKDIELLDEIKLELEGEN